MMRADHNLLSELFRAFLGLMFFVGGSIHAYLWATNQAVYTEITQFVLFDIYRAVWIGVVLPNLDILLPLLAVVEALVAIAILSKGQIARIGLTAGAAFNLAVAPLGFWWPSNVILAALHLVLLQETYTETTADHLTQRFSTGRSMR